MGLAGTIGSNSTAVGSNTAASALAAEATTCERSLVVVAESASAPFLLLPGSAHSKDASVAATDASSSSAGKTSAGAALSAGVYCGLWHWINPMSSSSSLSSLLLFSTLAAAWPAKTSAAVSSISLFGAGGGLLLRTARFGAFEKGNGIGRTGAVCIAAVVIAT